MSERDNILKPMGKFTNDTVDTFLKSLGIERLSNYEGANIPMKCRCRNCGKVFHPRLSNLKSSRRGHECIQWNSISVDAARSELLERGFEMIGEFSGSKKSVEARCIECKKISWPTLSNLRSNPRQGCKYCKRVFIDPEDGIRYLEESGFQIVGPWINASSPIAAICKKCARKIDIRYTEIKSGHGCAKCAGKLVDLDEAVEIMKLAGYSPLVPYPGSGKKWASIHLSCGREVSPIYGNILQGRGGCTSCAKWGFDNTKLSYLYFIYHPQFNSFKVGIANYSRLKKSDRVYRFKNQGWTVIKIWKDLIGSEAREIESEIFNEIRLKMSIPEHLNKEVMKKYNGHTETFSADYISSEKVLKIIETTIEGILR